VRGRSGGSNIPTFGATPTLAGWLGIDPEPVGKGAARCGILAAGDVREAAMNRTNGTQRTSLPWFAVLNPAAGGGRGSRDRARIEATLGAAGVPCRLAISEYPGHGIALAQAAASEGFRRFIAIGGDGTLNEVVNGLLSAGIAADEATLALLPVGRGDDWARTHRIPRRLEDAVRLIAAGRSALHDVGVAQFHRDGSRRHFLNVAGVGFDAYVVEQTRAVRLGPLSYLAGLLRGFASYRAPRMTLDADAIQLDQVLFVAFAAVGRYCGGGMHVAPAAVTDDGLLDVVTIGEIGRIELLLNLRRLFDGSLLHYAKVRSARCERLRVDTSPPAGVQADGELLGQAPVTFSVLPRALRVIVGEARAA
jgi:YegS/Rv2252/BmrU family lipid kinase